jgi:transposase
LNRIVTNPSDPLPSDLASAHALILAQRELLAKEQALRIRAAAFSILSAQGSTREKEASAHFRRWGNRRGRELLGAIWRSTTRLRL